MTEKLEKSLRKKNHIPKIAFTLQSISILPKSILLWLVLKLAKKLIDWRNKPMPILIYPDPRLKRIAEPVDFKNKEWLLSVN